MLPPLVLLLAALTTGTSPDSLTARGVSRQLAEYRASRVRDVRYELRLNVTGRDTAMGHVMIRFVRARGGDAILDFRGPRAGAPIVNGRATTIAGDGAHIRVPAALLRPGENTVELDFLSAIAPAGASIIRYHDSTDDTDYLYTLLVPSDAQALFPCFDQPDLKARITLTLVTPRGWKALGNGALESSDSAAGATVTHRFRRSDPISTYLIAFAAGPWTTRAVTVHGRPVSIWLRASRAKDAEVDTLIATNVRAIEWMERYTARPFPFQKFDFLLAPAFPFGGMEHPGAVFYNEESFIYREPPTRNQLLGREATIYHEVAHQWFGDFVTMRWFDDLWLKEGFATYISAVMQSDLSPAANAWRTFFLRNKPVAYATDASRGTTPVWQSLANLDQAKSNYGPIVYNKAPGILKQLNFMVGDTAFRDGLRAYLAAHPYGSATWSDLLSSVGSATVGRAHSLRRRDSTSLTRRETPSAGTLAPSLSGSGTDLTAWGRSYILRPGMPVISQRVTPAEDGWTLELQQAPAQTLSGSAPWPIRTQVLIVDSSGASRTVPMMLSSRRTTRVFRGPMPAMVFANAGDQAYALVHLDSASVRWAEEHVGTIADPLQKAMTWSAMWDLVRDARLAPARFVRAALRELPRERDDQLAPFVVGRAARALDAYLCDADKASLRVEAEQVFAANAADTTRSYSVRKAQLDALIELARSPAELAHVDAALDSSTIFGLPLRAPTRWAIVTRLVSLDAASSASRLASETRRDSTSEGRRRAFVAGAARPDSATKAAYWHRYFNDPSLNEEWVTGSLGAFNDADQDAITRRYLVPALDTLPWIQRNRRIFFLGSWIGAFMSGQRSAQSLELVEGLLRARPAMPRDLRAKVLQSEDELERTVRIRRACARP
ncbi:MAG TPA: M1 family aminopeptidase [Gemmatimonadaceae bacterium]|nr:M1 family aminopeptidase [Gemmatimonadaceae bacterium]